LKGVASPPHSPVADTQPAKIANTVVFVFIATQYWESARRIQYVFGPTSQTRRVDGKIACFQR
jgi:hypothetical protein